MCDVSWCVITGSDALRMLATDSCLSMLVSIISERHMNAVTAWPVLAGGGAAGATALALAAVDLIQVRVCGCWCVCVRVTQTL